MLAVVADHREALESLVMLCLHSSRPDEAEHLLRRLAEAYPAEPLYCERLATLLRHRGRGAEAIDCYRRLLQLRPELSNSRYNLARLLTLEGFPDEALQEYRTCLENGIARPEEVLANIGVIHTERHRHGEAREAFETALTHRPDHIPALYNLGLLHEEHGDWPSASGCFRRILEADPRHAGALGHLANGSRIDSAADPLIGALRRALNRPRLAPAEREELLYAMAKVHDDAGQYATAFEYCAQANRLSTERCGPYEPRDVEHLVDRLIATCDTDWLSSLQPVSDAPLVFVCGMFRSGTTLLEQMLGAHPDLVPGGELDFFQQRIRPFPEELTRATPGKLSSLGTDYIEYLAQHFSGGAGVINKRPDNFFLLGALAGLYPNVRILNTLRDPLDTCLSLFFQPMERGQAYANTLAGAGHFYLQHQRLMAHWGDLLGERMHAVNYEALLEEPRQTIASALAFLGLDWHDDCLQFHRARGRVRTASVHQVRQPLYARSRGRWRHYAGELEELRSLLRATDVTAPG